MDSFFVLLCTAFAVFFIFLQLTFRYWAFRGIPQLTFQQIIGIARRLQNLHMSEYFEYIYRECKGKYKVVGSYIFFKPVIVVLDLDVIKNIFIKDFNNFVSRFDDYEEDEKQPLLRQIARLHGNEWKIMRSKLTPTFTSVKMKTMFPMLVDIAENFLKTYEKELNNSPSKVLEVLDLSARYTTDVNGNVIFGIDCQSLYDKNSAFRAFGRKMFQSRFPHVTWRLFQITHRTLGRLFGAHVYHAEITKFIVGAVRKTVEFREENNIKINDLMGNLIELKNTKDENGNFQLSLSDLTAQTFIFFVAGFETSSGNISFTLYELAKHPDIQEKLRNEIFEVLKKHDNKLTYEAVQDMKYLKQVIQEALRVHTALTNLTRIAGQDYKVPGTDLVIPAGTKIFVPSGAIHMDPEIYDNPREFRPDRFSPEEIAKRHPMSFLAFGNGPRNCIGMRFAIMQSSIGLVTLLRNFRFSCADETPPKMAYSNSALICVADNGVRLRVEKL